MCGSYLFVLLNFVPISQSIDHIEGWNYINLHCRDNDYKPVDWWYIYKPPVDVVPFTNMGFNFSYITPDSGGRWQVSDKYITANSMLQHTFAPMFRPTYIDKLAVVSFEARNTTVTDNFARGLLMADEKGGVWIGHTVPGLPDFTKDRISFPQHENRNGHLIFCLSVDLVTLNKIALAVRQMSPQFTRVQLPEQMKVYLPAWTFLESSGPGLQALTRGLQAKDVLDFMTQNKSLRATLMVRKPGDKICLYKKFAQKKKLVLDVYGHTELRKPMCQKEFSLRKIDMISLKSPTAVSYIKGRDLAGFAVSTGARWQRLGGSGVSNYWACASGFDDAARGGLLLCVDNYAVWLSFDVLKVKEPGC